MYPLRLVWLICALMGAAASFLPLGMQIAAAGGKHPDPFGAWLEQRVAALTDPAMLPALVGLMIWVLAECYARRSRLALLSLPATLLCGIGCGLPFYLFLRTAKAI